MNESIDRMVAGIDRSNAEKAIGIILDFLLRKVLQTRCNHSSTGSQPRRRVQAIRASGESRRGFRWDGRIMGVRSRLIAIGLGIREVVGAIPGLGQFI